MDFSQIALLFVTASVFGIIAKYLRQPLFIGYLFAGIFLSLIGQVRSTEFLGEFSHIGITLLLFLLGLEMNLRDISAVGKPAVTTAVWQVLVTFILGFALSFILGYGVTPSLYIASALTFSSTIIAVRLLSDRDDLESLYGRMSVAILLVQDFIAVLILLFLSGSSGGQMNLPGYLFLFVKGFALLGLVWVLSKKTLPLIFEKITAKSNELLFIVSISWALGVSAFTAKYVGFNLEIGGFLAGLALSGLPEHMQIANKTKPLRDFFLTLFFLILGTNLIFNGDFLSLLPGALILSGFVFVSHLFVIMAIMGSLGYKKRTSFLVGMLGVQVSEFSLIIASVGLSLGHIGNYYLSLISLVAVITMVSSTYLNENSERLYERIKHMLKIFEKDLSREKALNTEVKYENHIVLVGCDRTGKQIIRYLEKKGLPLVVIDFNPHVYKDLTAENLPVVYGDFNDSEIIKEANIEKARLVILTTSNLSDNLNFLEEIRHFETKPKTIFTSSSKSDGIKLYEKGADFVIVPEMVAGEHIKHILKTFGLKGDKLTKAGQNHFKRLVFI